MTRLRAMRDDADEHCWRQREEGVINEAVNQVAFADKILINKIDLVNAQEKASVLNSIRSINAVAQVIETTQSRANLDQVTRMPRVFVQACLAFSYRVAARLTRAVWAV